MTGLEKLFDLLKPQYFDNLVAAVKSISGYESETHTFKTSSLSMHMGTTLKQKLIETNWNWEISRLALKALNENRQRKVKLLPLTKDVIKFQKYLQQVAEEACKALKENRQIKLFYRKLSECVLSLTQLLNRKRIGEIQHIKLETYNDNAPQNQQEKFLISLSQTEKMLAKKFKRIITERKGNTNEYLFANPITQNRWLSGYHSVKKLAQESGIENPSLFTSTRLRKQIATILQVIDMTQDELEQFANFMGHTRKTHETYYRLPQDIYQTAKVSKLLLAINSGKGSFFNKINLDDIDITDIECSNSEEEEYGGKIHDAHKVIIENEIINEEKVQQKIGCLPM
ncbi:hypothetical protein HHI36_023690 [Cryptolaemus montrouzieri]|uniref:Tyr recombinase domain-containing protein n=1 Tax=Cryptolaemus montrouzieri TaxID=559131 RepID=A0ABD2PI09_9CUCU